MAETLDVSSMISPQFEPKRKNRWLLAIEGVDAFLCLKAARPQMTTETIEVPWMNATRYVAGKQKFGTTAVTLHDAIAPSGAQQVMEWLRLQYESVSGRAGYADFYKRDIQLKLTDPVGTVIELWDGKGAIVADANYGDLDYSSADLQTIEMVIQCDNWVLQY